MLGILSEIVSRERRLVEPRSRERGLFPARGRTAPDAGRQGCRPLPRLACVRQAAGTERESVFHRTPLRIRQVPLLHGGRLICPAILTSERRQEDAAESWLAGMPKELYTGTHIVLDVPPGGETYSLAFVDAADESMRVKSVLDFTA